MKIEKKKIPVLFLMIIVVIIGIGIARDNYDNYREVAEASDQAPQVVGEERMELVYQFQEDYRRDWEIWHDLESQVTCWVYEHDVAYGAGVGVSCIPDRFLPGKLYE